VPARAYGPFALESANHIVEPLSKCHPADQAGCLLHGIPPYSQLHPRVQYSGSDILDLPWHSIPFEWTRMSWWESSSCWSPVGYCCGSGG